MNVGSNNVFRDLLPLEQDVYFTNKDSEMDVVWYQELSAAGAAMDQEQQPASTLCSLVAQQETEAADYSGTREQNVHSSTNL